MVARAALGTAGAPLQGQAKRTVFVNGKALPPLATDLITSPMNGRVRGRHETRVLTHDGSTARSKMNNKVYKVDVQFGQVGSPILRTGKEEFNSTMQ